MNIEFAHGKLLSDDANQVCVLFDPKDGRIVHVHGVTMLHSTRGKVDPADLEARARKNAEHFGKSVAALKALHVPMSHIRQNATLHVNESGDRLVPSPQVARFTKTSEC